MLVTSDGYFIAYSARIITQVAAGVEIDDDPEMSCKSRGLPACFVV